MIQRGPFKGMTVWRAAIVLFDNLFSYGAFWLVWLLTIAFWWPWHRRWCNWWRAYLIECRKRVQSSDNPK
jgi:hypothetical protein